MMYSLQVLFYVCVFSTLYHASAQDIPSGNTSTQVQYALGNDTAETNNDRNFPNATHLTDTFNGTNLETANKSRNASSNLEEVLKSGKFENESEANKVSKEDNSTDGDNDSEKGKSQITGNKEENEANKKKGEREIPIGKKPKSSLRRLVNKKGNSSIKKNDVNKNKNQDVSVSNESNDKNSSSYSFKSCHTPEEEEAINDFVKEYRSSFEEFIYTLNIGGEKRIKLPVEETSLEGGGVRIEYHQGWLSTDTVVELRDPVVMSRVIKTLKNGEKDKKEQKSKKGQQIKKLGKGKKYQKGKEGPNVKTEQEGRQENIEKKVGKGGNGEKIAEIILDFVIPKANFGYEFDLITEMCPFHRIKGFAYSNELDYPLQLFFNVFKEGKTCTTRHPRIEIARDILYEKHPFDVRYRVFIPRKCSTTINVRSPPIRVLLNDITKLIFHPALEKTVNEYFVTPPFNNTMNALTTKGIKLCELLKKGNNKC